jgi:hypothetical protein
MVFFYRGFTLGTWYLLGKLSIMSPHSHCVTASLAQQAFGSCLDLEFWVKLPRGKQ